jgi:hypothetical protein
MGARTQVWVTIAIFLLCAPLIASSNKYVEKASAAERASRIQALTAAYEAVDGALLNSKGKVIVIKELEDGMLRVSFLNHPHERKYGGNAHVTYDTKMGKVVSIEAED